MQTLGIVVISAWAGLSASAPPPMLPLQGALRNVGGAAVDGTFDLKIRLYDGETAVAPFFEEDLYGITVTDGLVNAVLGVTQPLDPETVSGASEVWIGIKVEGDPELPRRQVVSVPFALVAGHSQSSDEAAGLSCSGCVTAGHLAPGVLAAVATSGSWSDLADVPPDADSLAALPCTVGQIPKLGDPDWGCADDLAGQVATAPPVPCDASAIGQMYFDAGAEALRLCDGQKYRRLKLCDEDCPVPASIACGAPVQSDCGDDCGATGTAPNPAQCPAASSAVCGAVLLDDCDNVCATGGSGLNTAQCDAVGVDCGEPVFDECQNSCGVTGALCAGATTCQAGECVAPTSCKALLEADPDADSGTHLIDPDGPGGKAAFEVTCDMDTAPGGWTRIDMDYLRLRASLSTSTNANGESHGFVNGNQKYYGYPHQHDYEVFNDFDLGFDYTSIRGTMQFYPSNGSVAGWTTSGAHPDNQDYGIQVDTDYNELGVTGEGSGNKSWHRWGKPGQVFHAYNQLGWSGEWSSAKTLSFGPITVVPGPVIRVSTFSESGDPPKERWAFTATVFVR